MKHAGSSAEHPIKCPVLPFYAILPRSRMRWGTNRPTTDFFTRPQQPRPFAPSSPTATGRRSHCTPPRTPPVVGSTAGIAQALGLGWLNLFLFPARYALNTGTCFLFSTCPAGGAAVPA